MDGVCFESPALEALPFEDLGPGCASTAEPQTTTTSQLVSKDYYSSIFFSFFVVFINDWVVCLYGMMSPIKTILRSSDSLKSSKNSLPRTNSMIKLKYIHHSE